MLILIAIISIITLMGCKTSQTSSLSLQSSPTMPSVDFTTYSISYVAIRNKEEDGRSQSIDYYYDNFNDVNILVDSISIDLGSMVPNGGIGPKSGRYNDGWIELVGIDNSILILNLYLIEDKTILGVYFTSNMTEYYFNDMFIDQVLSILEYYQS
jgi:hypothetical protein